MKKILTVLLLLIGALQYSRAQTTQLRFDHFTTKEGLPDPQIGFIKQDGPGYIWIGTVSGLVRYDGYNLKRYIADKKYPDAFVTTMITGANNNLWFGAAGNGFARYDHENDNFTVYAYPAPDNEHRYAQNIICVDGEGNIWGYRYDFSDLIFQIVKFDTATKRYTFFSKQSYSVGAIHLSSGSPAVIYSTGKPGAAVWMGDHDGLHQYNYRDKTFHPFMPDSGTARKKTIYRIFSTPAEPEILWLNAFDHSSKRMILERLDTRNKTFKYYSHTSNPGLTIANDTVNDLYEDRKYRIWVGTKNGLMRYNAVSETFTPFIPADTDKGPGKNNIKKIAEAKDGSLWLSTGKGLLNFDPEKQVFKRYSSKLNDPSGLSSNDISALLVDNTGVLWVGNTQYGVDKLNPLTSIFQIYPVTVRDGTAFTPGDTNNITVAADGACWFTNDQGIFKWKPGTDKPEEIYKKKKSDQGLDAIMMDRDGKVYFCNGNGLQIYDPVKRTTQSYSYQKNDNTSISSNRIDVMLQDHSGLVWIGTIYGGVCSFDPLTRRFRRYPYIINDATRKSRGELDDHVIDDIYEDRAGTLWIATLSGGLNRFDRKTGKFTSYLFDGPLNVHTITHLFEDKQGRFWVGTFALGLFEFDRKTGHYTRHFTEDDGLLINTVTGISQDKEGFLLISSVRGLTRINPVTLTMKTFPLTKILPGRSPLIDWNMVQTRDQVLFILTDGIAAFDPGKLDGNPYAPVVHIEKVGHGNPASASDSVVTKPAFGAHELELPYNQNRIVFDYIALHYADPSRNIYAYQLDGYDNHWIQAGAQRSATYTNLSPGTYTFQVKAANSDGVWNNKGDSFIIIISPPWWQTWWAYTLFVLAFAGSVWGFIHYRSLALIREKRILEDTVQLRTHEVMEQKEELLQQKEVLEVQAREAEIEVALERVRSRSLAMHKSDELREVVRIVFEKLEELDFKMDGGVTIFIFSEGSRDTIAWTIDPEHLCPAYFKVPYVDLLIMSDFWTAKENGLYFFAKSYSFDEKNTFWKLLFEHTDYKYLPDNRKNLILEGNGYGYSVALAKNSAIFIANLSGELFSKNENEILIRFGKVFEHAYIRFLDLKKAEEQAREVIKQASLDRVRGEIASMRTTADLGRIIPLIWNELTILGIPFIRCGVFIVNEGAELIHTHLSTPDGKALAAFDLPFDAEGIGREVLPAWRKKQMAAVHWSAAEFAANTKNLVSQGAVKSRGKYVTERPNTTLDLHFFPFLQGMLYAGNTAPLTDDERDLVQSLAEAFSTAYARYEDFNKLEAAKQQVDKTLTELKAAQTQLIQTEKMASLGELTAGIAHEIQNPLNFVNNFSEVNTELIDEMQEEIEKGSLAEIKAIAIDIRENEKKINLHGKRADSIVKGMLQHSQSGSGAKELININTLADEYMRLAYHGLRAKDKSFNAEMVTHFDPKLPKIRVIGQDMGRVLLNLFNNAFYAVNQRKKTDVSDYKPEVTITTSVESGHVIIKVKDNGIGIPDAIKEKIMQPFFTTKPTGEGTGLGLSLTYDMVVKGHGGNIEVNTKEGEFTEFIVFLPV